MFPAHRFRQRPLRFRINENPPMPSVHTRKACSMWYFSTPAVPGFEDHFQSVSATLLVGCRGVAQEWAVESKEHNYNAP